MSAAARSRNFVNPRNASLTVFKFFDKAANRRYLHSFPTRRSSDLFFIDLNANHLMDAGAETTGSQLTDGSGNTTFSGLTPGTYSFCEVLQPTWHKIERAPV